MEAAAQRLAAACYAVDAYRDHSGETLEVPGEVRRAVAVLSALSLDLTRPCPASTGTEIHIPEN